MTRALALAVLAASLFFAAVPALDIATSRLFFDGKAFPVQANAGVEALRMTLYWAEDLAALFALVMLLATAWAKRPLLGMTARAWGYGFAVFALGPGLLVNGILKPVFGRARPWRVAEFGGDLLFTPAWQISGQCKVGCSFVSGEAAGSVALALLLAMMLAANRRRLGQGAYRLGLVLAATLPLVTAWQRVAAGKHFLSDVVLGALLTGLVAALVAQGFGRVWPRLSGIDKAGDSP